MFFHASRNGQVRVIAECDGHRVLVMDEQNDALIQADASMLMGPIQDEPHNYREHQPGRGQQSQNSDCHRDALRRAHFFRPRTAFGFKAPTGIG
jgi:hypothetical protein